MSLTKKFKTTILLGSLNKTFCDGEKEFFCGALFFLVTMTISKKQCNDLRVGKERKVRTRSWVVFCFSKTVKTPRKNSAPQPWNAVFRLILGSRGWGKRGLCSFCCGGKSRLQETLGEQSNCDRATTKSWPSNQAKFFRNTAKKRFSTTEKDRRPA